ncbi:MAG: hypothetical protein P4L46_03580, partial [Fimbriimonas sp.]|nr:hypothetical protein [Fimbriimonas sp.]
MTRANVDPIDAVLASFLSAAPRDIDGPVRGRYEEVSSMLTGGLDRAVRLFMDLVTTPALGKDWSTNLGSEE